MNTASKSNPNTKQTVLVILLASSSLATATIVTLRLHPKPNAQEVANHAIHALKAQNDNAYANLAAETQLTRNGITQYQLKEAFKLYSPNITIDNNTAVECQTYDNQITQCTYKVTVNGTPSSISFDIAKVKEDFKVINPLSALFAPQHTVAKMQVKGQPMKNRLAVSKKWALATKTTLAPLGIHSFESGSDIVEFDNYIQKMDSAIAKWEESEKQ